MNATLELMAAHRSIRRFAERPVDESLVAEVVRAARHAATSHAIQAYSLLRVRDRAQRARLAELCGGQAQVEQAPVFLVVCGDQRRHRLAAEARQQPYVGNLETFLLAVIDASLFAQNLALGFESCGLGICYIGGLRNRLPEVDGLLEVPHGVLPLFGLCAGWPAEDPAPRPRLAPEACFYDARWPHDAELRAAIARHDAALEPLAAARGRPGRDWSSGTTRLFAKAAREHLCAYYTSKGAALR